MKNNKKIISVVLALLIVLVGGFGVYKYFNNTKSCKVNPENKPKAEAVKKASTQPKSLDVEAKVTAEGDENTVTVTMNKEKFDKLNDTEKNKIYDQVGEGVDGYSPVITLDRGLIAFSLKDQDGKEIVLKDKPTAEITSYPGFVSLPEASAIESTKHTTWKATLDHNGGSYIYDIGEYFKEHPGEDNNACLVKITYTVDKETFVTFTSVVLTTMGAGK